ncbi:hypothetical protein BLOT_002730, partial [Blomia tropicalis]
MMVWLYTTLYISWRNGSAERLIRTVKSWIKSYQKCFRNIFLTSTILEFLFYVGINDWHASPYIKLEHNTIALQSCNKCR